MLVRLYALLVYAYSPMEQTNNFILARLLQLTISYALVEVYPALSKNIMTDRQIDIMGQREVTLPIIEKNPFKSILFHKLVNLFERSRMPVGRLVGPMYPDVRLSVGLSVGW